MTGFLVWRRVFVFSIWQDTFLLQNLKVRDCSLWCTYTVNEYMSHRSPLVILPLVSVKGFTHLSLDFLLKVVRRFLTQSYLNEVLETLVKILHSFYFWLYIYILFIGLLFCYIFNYIEIKYPSTTPLWSLFSKEPLLDKCYFVLYVKIFFPLRIVLSRKCSEFIKFFGVSVSVSLSTLD